MYYWLEVKFLQLLSSRLENFKKKDGNLYNCRCILCNDSQKSKRKARGYFYQREGSLRYHCHNCSIDISFPSFLKRVDPRLYSEFQIEKIQNSKRGNIEDINIPKNKFDLQFACNSFSKFKLISKLDDNHLAKKYIIDRKLPLDLFRWIPNFMQWTNELIPKKFDENALKYDQGRIVIPFYNRNNQFFAYQGRIIDAFCNHKRIIGRYISILLDENEHMLYGMERINFNKDVYVTEGPLDSLFLDNGMAIAGSNFSALTKFVPCNRIVMIWDNESRNKETIKKIKNSIDCGLRVVIWPDNIIEKDINDMIVAGMTKDYLQYVISNNTFEGMKAKIRLNFWSKI